MPSVSMPRQTTQQRPLSSMPSSITTARRRSPSGRDIRSMQVLARARDELAADRRLARRAGELVDVAADRLTGPRVAARRDAGQHPLEHHVGELVTRREVRIGIQLDLALAVGGPGARPADRHPAAPERDLAALVAVADRGAVAIVSALRADDLVDLGLHDLVQHAQPDADAQRQQPFLRRAGQLTQRVLDPLRQPLDAACADQPRRQRDLRFPWRSSCLDGLVRTRHAASGSGRGGRTAVHQVLRATGQPPAPRPWRAAPTLHRQRRTRGWLRRRRPSATPSAEGALRCASQRASDWAMASAEAGHGPLGANSLPDRDPPRSSRL